MLAFTQPVLVGASLTDDLQAEINQKRDQIQELEKQISAYNEMLKGAQNQSSTLKNEITKIETQIKRLGAQISLTQTQISQTSLMIQGLASDIETKNIELEKNKNNLSSILQTINEYDQESPLFLVLGNQNFSDFLNQTQYLQNLQASVGEKLTAIKDLRDQLRAQKAEQENNQADLENLKTQLRGKNSALAGQKSDEEDLLTTSKNQEKVYQSTLSDLQQKRQQIENEIYLAEQKLRQIIDPNSIPGAKKGLFIWPVSALISQSFGCIETKFARQLYPACDNGLGGFHNGIDLAADYGDPIRTTLDGTISGMGNLGKYAYGKWITINHENGLTTLYGHMSAQSVSVGQKVKTGDAIGYVGSTGYSTGAHLHFTVYATNTFSIQQKWYGPVPLGGPIDPMLYLP